MKTMKGPAIFLAQFAGDKAPFNSLKSIAKWAARSATRASRSRAGTAGFFDLAKAASSKTYCDEITGICREAGVEITELSTHLQGQLVAVHPAYDTGFDAFARAGGARQSEGAAEMGGEADASGAKASKNLGLKATVSFTGALAWPYLYPWPPRSPGLIETAFDELAKRWKPILDAYDDAGVDVGFELHPGEDVMDGATFEMFLERLGNHPRCGINYDPSHFVLQQLDYLEFIDFYHERIFAFHVKDAEFNPTGRQGVYSGFQGWVKRAGRFRSLGDGQVDFSAHLLQARANTTTTAGRCSNGNARSRSSEQGAAEGAPFIAATSSR